MVTPTYGGRRVRVRLSNRLGASSVTFVARRRSGAELVPGTSRRLRFGGKLAVTIGPGREVVSDAVGLRFRAFQDLAVSVHLRGPAGAASRHFLASQTSYSSAQASGDHADETAGSSFTGKLGSWSYLPMSRSGGPGASAPWLPSRFPHPPRPAAKPAFPGTPRGLPDRNRTEPGTSELPEFEKAGAEGGIRRRRCWENGKRSAPCGPRGPGSRLT